MARIQHVKRAQQRYAMKPVLDADGQQVKVPVMNPRTGQQKVTKTGRPVWQKQTVRDYDKPLPMPRCDYPDCPDREIKVGTPYVYVDLQTGTKYRHADHPQWQPWDLSSAMWARVAQVVDAAEQALDALGDFEDVDDVKQVLGDAADEIRGLAEERTEAADNMEDGFGHETEASERLREHAENLEGFADDLENFDPDTGPDADDYHYDADGEDLGTSDGDPADLYNSDGECYDDALATWRDEVLDEAREALADTPEVS